MNTQCPHCQIQIEIDPETHAALQGHAHFQCPSCDGLVPVPPVTRAPVKVTAATVFRQKQSPAAARPPTNAIRGLNRNLLILGSAALLVLGGLGFFIASKKSGDTNTTSKNIRNEIIKNSYFQNLIAAGVTTEDDLLAVTDIRPYADGFIGISKEPVGLEYAQNLANRTGSEILPVEDRSSSSKTQLLKWVGEHFGSYLSSTVWVSEHGAVSVLDGIDLFASTATGRKRKVILAWGLGNNQDALATLQIGNPVIDATTGKVSVNGVDSRRPTIPFTWDWGDGTSHSGWFPSSHTYQDTNRDYTLTVTAHYSNGEESRGHKTISFAGKETNAAQVQADLHQALRAANPSYNGNGKFTVKNGQIVVVDLNHCGITDLTPLRGLPLSSLELWQSKVRDLSPLVGMKLKRLNIGGCTGVSDISALKGMPLESLHMAGVRAADLNALEDAPLTSLNIYDTPVSDLTPLRKSLLEILDAGSCDALRDLSPLRGLPLRELHVNGTEVEDLTPLKELQLNELSVSDTRVSDLSPLANCPLMKLRFTIRNIKNGINEVRAIRTLVRIEEGRSNDIGTAEEFWRRLDAQ